jgi:hypothetical protein
MSLETPDKIRSLQRKLYCKAKAEQKAQGERTRTNRFSEEHVFGELAVLRLQRVRRVPTPWALR